MHMLRFLLVLTFLIVAREVRAEAVLCIERDSETGALRGAVETRDGACAVGELQIGSVIDSEEGRILLDGVEVQMPEGMFFPENLPEEQGGEGSSNG